MSAFGGSPPFSVGVEEELFLVDAETLEPVPVAAEVVPEPGPRIKHELFASVVEITTPVCADAGEVFDELRRLRTEVAERAAKRGAKVLASGTHPTAVSAEQPITPEPLYLNIATKLGPALSRQFVCGLHVHVGVPDEQSCLNALETVIRFLPSLLSMSANSPFVDGADSGLKSARAEALAALPNGGAPPVFRTWADWEARTAGIDYRRLHWDIRPHPDYGTLEVRICDQQTDVRRSAGFAALIQALVRVASRVDGKPYTRELYEERRRQAAAQPPDVDFLAQVVESDARQLRTWDTLVWLFDSRPEAEMQLAIGLPGVVEALASMSS